MEEEITLKFKKYEIENLLKLLEFSSCCTYNGSLMSSYPFYLRNIGEYKRKERQFAFTENSIRRQLEAMKTEEK